MDWSPEEVAAIVADYLAMLTAELRGEPVNKKEHNRQLQKVLHGRSPGAIEFKHANISAVMIELGFPYIDGYKPRGNYQELLRDEIIVQMGRDKEVLLLTTAIVNAPAPQAPTIRSLDDILVPPPIRQGTKDRIYDNRRLPAVPRKNVNYLEIDARNATLGLSGELFALQVEHQRLWSAGHRTLADRIEHVSQTKGDGLGYDILSFEPDGNERLIEVKTTSFGALTPFFATKREVMLSSHESSKFNLYRVFSYRKNPQLFILSGSLKDSCVIDPIIYRASFP